MSNQALLFQPSWNGIKVSDLPNWPRDGRVCIDVETRDDHLLELGPGVRRGGYITSIQFAIENGPSHYLPIAFGGGDNLDKEAVLSYITDQAKNFNGVIVGANLQYDLDFLAEVGVVFPNVKWFRDIQIAGPIINEYERSYSLENIAKRMGISGKDDADLKAACKCSGIKVPSSGKKWMSEIWKLPARYVKDYAIQDVELPLQISRFQERIIDREDLWNIYNLESQVLPVLLKMRRKGVSVDEKRLDEIDNDCTKEGKEALKLVFQETGIRISYKDVWLIEPYIKALKTIGVEPDKTVKGADSVSSDLLSDIGHPVAKALLHARRVSKVQGTFVSLVRRHLVNGRVHGTFNQLRRTKDDGDLVGTITGRLSGTDPNWQFQPSKRSTFGPRWRGIYKSDEGGIWASCDYSQQEFRLAVHLSVLAKCKGSSEAANEYIKNPNTDAHDAVAKMVGIDRSLAKTINFGIIYGMGGGKMCRRLGLPTVIKEDFEGKRRNAAGPEGQAILDKFNQNAPYLRLLSKKAQRAAEKRGYVKTILGRKCRFPIKNNKRDWTYIALNKIIQGSAADQTKKAMVDVDAAGFEIQLQIHDELDLTVNNQKEAMEVVEIMQTCVPLKIPVRVDVKTGPSWGEIQ